MTRRPISGARRLLRGRPTLRPRRRKAILLRRSRRAIRRSPAPGALRLSRVGGGFLQNAASTAAGVAGGVALGNLLGGLFGGHAGGGLFGGGGVGGAGLFGGGVPGGGNETVNIFEEAPDRGNADQQFDPGAPGVQDANFDQLDNSTFDSSDDSSYGGDGGGGYDDV